MIAKIIFLICAAVAVVAVFSISVYMIVRGTPAFAKVGVLEMLFGTDWSPTDSEPSYGIALIILSSIVGTAAAILIGVPIGLLTAVFIAEVAPKRLAAIVQPAVELLAAIPSVIYGLLGSMIISPILYKLEKIIFANSTTHQYTGGSNLLAAIIVLAVMILPNVINITVSSLKAVQSSIKSASLALGATKIQTIFKVMIPAAQSGIMTGVVLGIGRAIGEAMAVNMVAGGVVNIPLPFNSVAFLTTTMVSGMAYSSGTYREALFSIGLVLFIFIMIVNLAITMIEKKGAKED
ncbi:MAG: phosphate ABC transporter permease subunit PstC [Clostridiales bacterium]|nr:phosphate ABC transporter permease subunit PstC [Clostridiales bacterium]